MNQIIDTIKQFNFKEFNWKEACSNDKGQSSAALYICFWFGISLIWLTFVTSILMIINSFHKLEVDFTPVFLFIGSQMGVVLTYLFARLNSNNKIKLDTVKEKENNGTGIN